MINFISCNIQESFLNKLMSNKASHEIPYIRWKFKIECCWLNDIFRLGKIEALQWTSINQEQAKFQWKSFYYWKCNKNCSCTNKGRMMLIPVHVRVPLIHKTFFKKQHFHQINSTSIECTAFLYLNKFLQEECSN